MLNLDGLNEKQIEAVTSIDGYYRVIAGTGSGKTKALTHRYAYLVGEAGIPPRNILCVTFTNKAACVKSWDILSTFFAYPLDIRKTIYTTNIIEGLNQQFCKVTKNKPSFTNDDSLRKMLYLASKKFVEHWACRCRNWDCVLNHLNILFGDRVAG